jgi:hypothetical protein
MSNMMKCTLRGSGRRSLVGLLCSLACGLGACNPGVPASAAPDHPGADDLRRALHSGYATPKGRRQECLARLVFDPSGDIEWGISKRGLSSGDKFRFTATLPDGQDYAAMGDVSLVVLAPSDWSDIVELVESQEAETAVGIYYIKKEIEIAKRRINGLQELLDDPSKNRNGEDLSTYPQGIADLKRQIAEYEAGIAKSPQYSYRVDWGIPQTLGYRAGSSLYAFALRDGRAYKFMSFGGEGVPPFEERERAFRQMLHNFRPRKLYEIPKEPGICFPYGFVADDGKEHSRIEVSMRYKDRPGVIYTISSAVVGEHGVPGPEPAMIQATARASTGILAGAIAAGRTVKTLGPRAVEIGALPAWQGGIAMNTADPGKPPVVSYSIYTGTGGWPHSRVLPNITVNLRSFTREQEPDLPADPPSFDESISRLDQLIQSMRLRPTQPLMPELAGLETADKR